jgi:hypothetical protein
MKRVMAVTLAATQLLCGCATPQTFLPRGQDSNQLVEAIARRGQGEGPVEPEAPGSFLLADCLTTGAKVGATCLLIPVVLVYLWAGRGEGIGPGTGAGVDGALHRIWSGN